MDRHLLSNFERSLVDDGLDLVVPRGLAKIRADCDRLGMSLPARINPIGIFIGNSRALWPRFSAAVRARPALRASEHPLDQWVEERIAEAISQLDSQANIAFGHHQQALGYFPLQHWARELGVFALSPSHLSVHRDYGPWIALRALVVVDIEASELVTPVPSQPVGERATGERAAEGRCVDVSAATEPCAHCAAPCREPFERAALESAQATDERRVTEHWRQWLAVRDACPVGLEYRYSDAQIRYHYARDPHAFDE